MTIAEQYRNTKRGNQLVLKILVTSLTQSGYKFRYVDSTKDFPYLRSKRLTTK